MVRITDIRFRVQIDMLHDVQMALLAFECPFQDALNEY